MAQRQDAIRLQLATADTHCARDAQYFKGVGMVLLAGTFWSITGIVIRLMESAGEWQILFYRSLAMVPTLLIIIGIRTGGAFSMTFAKTGVTGPVAGLFLASSFSCFVFSMTHTTVANTLFLLCSAPFMTAVLARIILGERANRNTWIAMAFSALGITIMVGGGIAAGTLFGNITALGATLGFAGFTIALRWGKTVDMLPAVCYAGIFTVLIAGIMSLVTGQGFAVSVHDWLLCALLGVVQIGLGLAIYTVGSRYVPATELVLLSLTEVVLGPLWVWLGIGETPSALTLLGGAIVLAAIAGHGVMSVRKRPPLGVV